MSLPTLRLSNPQHVGHALAVAAVVVTISGLHYVTSLHSPLLQEAFDRLYYLPIGVAAVRTGRKGGLAVSVVSSLLYLAHAGLHGRAWPALVPEQYSEVLMFNLVALVTGGLADRLRFERQRHLETAAALREAYSAAEAGNDGFVRMDWCAPIGRISSDIAHEVRTPLGGLLGAVEILEAEFPQGHPKLEFVVMAKREITRLQRVVTEFLELAQPPPPHIQATDLRVTTGTMAQLARPALARHAIGLEVRAMDTAVTADVDGEQLQRALLNITLAAAPWFRNGHICVAVEPRGHMGEITVQLDRGPSAPPEDDRLEPFTAWVHGDALALTTAERLIKNQRGTVRVEIAAGRLRYVIGVPSARPSAARTGGVRLNALPCAPTG